MIVPLPFAVSFEDSNPCSRRRCFKTKPMSQRPNDGPPPDGNGHALSPTFAKPCRQSRGPSNQRPPPPPPPDPIGYAAAPKPQYFARPASKPENPKPKPRPNPNPKPGPKPAPPDGIGQRYELLCSALTSHYSQSLFPNAHPTASSAKKNKSQSSRKGGDGKPPPPDPGV